jgi:O-antigen/teichoic acid export membrane protein
MPNEDSYLDVSLRKIAKGAGFVLIGTIIGRAFGYGSRLIIARLGASDYGLITLGFAVMSIAATLSLVGIQSGIIRYVSFEQIIKTLFGAEYIAGATALSILVFGFMVYGAVGPAGAILRSYGRTKTVMWTNYLGAVINLGLNFLLIPIYGVNGAAIATGFALGLLYILNFVFAYLKTGGNEMDLPYNWDFIQSNISSEKLAELRRRFIAEWRSGRYRKKK